MIKLFSYGKLQEGTLLRRYKRFLADVSLQGKGTVTVFCPNSGSMMGMSEPGMPVFVSPSSDPKRKTKWTLEAVRAGRTWVGVNTHLTNKLAGILIERALVDGLKGYGVRRPEVTVGASRLDFLLEGRQDAGKELYLEVKSVTLRVGREARFPDAVTTRGAKHLRELMGIARKGDAGAAMLYVVQRSDCGCFSAADDIDPEYGRQLREALKSGVRAYVVELSVRRDGIYFRGRMEFCE